MRRRAEWRKCKYRCNDALRATQWCMYIMMRIESVRGRRVRGLIFARVMMDETAVRLKG